MNSYINNLRGSMLIGVHRVSLPTKVSTNGGISLGSSLRLDEAPIHFAEKNLATIPNMITVRPCVGDDPAKFPATITTLCFRARSRLKVLLCVTTLVDLCHVSGKIAHSGRLKVRHFRVAGPASIGRTSTTVQCLISGRSVTTLGV